MTETIGFIGLGDLGRPIAANLLAAGYGLRVHNRTAAKADALVAQGAHRADRAVDAVRAGGIVATLLWDDASVEEVVTRDGFLERLGPGGVHISMSTVSPEGSKRLAALHAAHGCQFVEAPVFGRPEAAVARQLWIVCAGAQAAKDRVRPVLEAMGAREIFDFGEAIGAATTLKLLGNFLLISAAQSLTEGLSMVEKSGFDPRAALDMLTRTLFPSPIYQTYGRMIVEKSGGFSQSPIPAKDLGLFTAAADQLGAPAPLASLLLELRTRGA
ncbi:NAD(P)-dependent oxidoreductase [Phenylobacterium sp.]|uniref:NAD(P)-dependent oxidoreductase n=1 Tax=Phenylobacterium sp. TaxID=1871053 RepID=UPI0025EDB7AA|nr:NAD(P)-dependent oxidoreductase [Phenylobacterium sp.]